MMMWFSARDGVRMAGIGSFNCAIAHMAPSTAIAPHLSNTIRCMFAAGLIEMPPVSKVIALPTMRSGFRVPGPGFRVVFFEVFAEPEPRDPEPDHSSTIIL